MRTGDPVNSFLKKWIKDFKFEFRHLASEVCEVAVTARLVGKSAFFDSPWCLALPDGNSLHTLEHRICVFELHGKFLGPVQIGEKFKNTWYIIAVDREGSAYPSIHRYIFVK